MTPATVLNCPLCAWSHEMPPFDQRIASGTLASVFGPGVFAAHAINERARQGEEVLATHFATHDVVAWLQGIVGAQKERDEAREQVRRLHRSFGILIQRFGGSLEIFEDEVRKLSPTLEVVEYQRTCGDFVYVLREAPT